jgi:hypothetical protein
VEVVMQEHRQLDLALTLVKQEQLTLEVVEVELHLLMVLQQEMVEQEDLVL